MRAVPRLARGRIWAVIIAIGIVDPIVKNMESTGMTVPASPSAIDSPAKMPPVATSAGARGVRRLLMV
ncbi:Uncharacterised protein [Chlamydia trachomatis]|nr:Uncharacterised protein [Chlamydia trachomatis]